VVIMHAFLALASGFATIAMLGLAMSRLLATLTPEWVGEQAKPMPGYVLVHLGGSFLIAASGGYVTALAAAANPLIHVLALGIVVLLMAALSALQTRGKLPIWYQLALVAVSPLGVLAGGLLRLRVIGIL